TRAIRVRAFAKINLSLHVLGARSDGYHELRTTFQSLALHDTLTCRARPGPFHIVCDDEACPADESNLVWRAAERLWASAGRRASLRRRAAAPPAWVTLIVPVFGVSTADAYRWFDEVSDPRGAKSPALQLAPLQNDLEAPVAARHPEIAHLVEALRREGASPAAMSGSGSAVFGLFNRRAGASPAARALAPSGPRVVVARALATAGSAR